MLWMSASATSGEWPRMVDHWSLGISLVLWPTRPYVNGTQLFDQPGIVHAKAKRKGGAFACERGARQPGARNACGTSRRLCKV